MSCQYINSNHYNLSNQKYHQCIRYNNNFLQKQCLQKFLPSDQKLAQKMTNQISTLFSEFQSSSYKIAFTLQNQFKIEQPQLGLYMFMIFRYEIFKIYQQVKSTSKSIKIKKYIETEIFQLPSKDFPQNGKENQKFIKMLEISQSIHIQTHWFDFFQEMASTYGSIFQDETELLWVLLDTIFSLLRFFLQNNNVNSNEKLIKQNIDNSLFEALSIFNENLEFLYDYEFKTKVNFNVNTKKLLVKMKNFQEKFSRAGEQILSQYINRIKNPLNQKDSFKQNQKQSTSRKSGLFPVIRQQLNYLNEKMQSNSNSEYKNQEENKQLIYDFPKKADGRIQRRSTLMRKQQLYQIEEEPRKQKRRSKARKSTVKKY